MRNDLYGILNVAFNATQAEIKQSYRDLAKQYHPDKFKEGSSSAINAAERFKEISGAYDTLKDSNKRQTYDRTFHRGFSKTDTSTSSTQNRPVYEDHWGGNAGASNGFTRKEGSALDVEWKPQWKSDEVPKKEKSCLDVEWGSDFSPS